MFAVSLIIKDKKLKEVEYYFILENKMPLTGTTSLFGGLYVNGYPATNPFDAPNVIICSSAEMEAATPSDELQAYKNMNVNSKSWSFSSFFV